MRLLLDANVLLPAVLTPHLLRSTLRTLLSDEQNDLLVSHATLWELLAKVHRGDVMQRGKSVIFSSDAIEKPGAEFVPILTEDILAAVALPDIHRDPFDRMLIAQAQRLQARIVSSDRELHRYGVTVLSL